jgi:hypothetical protein
MRSRNSLWSAKIDSGVDLDLSGHLWGHRPAIWVVGLEISRRGDQELTLTRRHIIFLGHFSCYFGQNRREWPETLIHILVFFAEIGPKTGFVSRKPKKYQNPIFTGVFWPAQPYCLDSQSFPLAPTYYNQLWQGNPWRI